MLLSFKKQQIDFEFDLPHVLQYYHVSQLHVIQENFFLVVTSYFLRQFLAVGQLSIALSDGPMHPITAGTAGPQAAIRLTHRRVLWWLMLHPDLAFGESYMDGDLQIESGDIDDLMALLVANREHWQNHWLARLVLTLDTRLARFSGLNFPGRAKRNVAHHYDLKDSLFDNFLDPWRQYSCAYFRSPDEPLADAQITKLSRIAAQFFRARAKFDSFRALVPHCGTTLSTTN